MKRLLFLTLSTFWCGTIFTTLAQSNSTILYSTDSTTYWLLAGTMSWNEAQAESEFLGGHLVTLNSQAENVAVFEAFHAVDGIQPEDGYFIGLFQNTNSVLYVEPAGGWEWVSQGMPEYFNWRSNEPNSGGNNGVENCANVFGESQGVGFWNDCSCSIASLYAVAEVPTGAVVSGCTDSTACNYDAAANIDDGTCASCEILATACGQGTVWDAESGTCIVANPSDSNFDGCVQLNDLLDLLSAYGNCGAEEVPWQCGDPLEYQGYDYATVLIGEQCWLAENLRNELYRNGDSIQANLSDEEWGSTDFGGIGATTVFGEPSFLCEEFSPDGDGCDEAWSLTAYGRLYNWYALNDARGLCPAGWHVPSDEEWTSLTDQFGGLSNAGDELKSASGWYQGGNGSNASGFSALPGGIRNGGNGSFQHAGSKAFFWTATETIDREFTFWQDAVSRQSSKSLKKGMSVRCLKDLEE